jgi:nucleotide-binding universal stress UspA family protein
MSTSALWLVVVVVWVASSVGLGIVMGRRGYSAFGWGVIGGAMGPIGVVLALLLHGPHPPDRWTSAGRAADGPVDVLVGTDGSAASVAAALAAISLVDGRLGRLTIAAVEAQDANTAEAERTQRELLAVAALVDERLSTLGASAGTVVLHGRPADALRDRAVAGGYDVIAVGSHGHGLSPALLGSVAAALVDRSPVPLLVSGRSTTAASALEGAPPVAGVVGA